MIDKGQAVVYYELTGPVQSRWLADCVVKIVDNQWFLAYGDDKWTEKTEEALAAMDWFILQLKKLVPIWKWAIMTDNTRVPSECEH